MNKPVLQFQGMSLWEIVYHSPKEAVETRTNTDTKAFLQFCLLLVCSPSIFHECFCHGSHYRYQRLWDSSVFSVCLDTAASPGHFTVSWFSGPYNVPESLLLYISLASSVSSSQCGRHICQQVLLGP